MTEIHILIRIRRRIAIKMTDLSDLPASRIWRALHESVNFVHDPEKQYKSLSVAHRPGGMHESILICRRVATDQPATQIYLSD